MVCRRGVDGGCVGPGHTSTRWGDVQITNVGTEPVADATLILNRSTPDSDQPTTNTAVPRLAPGEVVRTERILYGQYDVHFTYPLFAPLDPILDAGGDAGVEAGYDAGFQ